MSARAVIAALGAPEILAGYELAGARLIPAKTDEDVRQAWSTLPEDTAVVLLTADAAAALAGHLDNDAAPLTVALPA